MTKWKTKIAMLILFVAMFAFVVDVISPATPTPTARMLVAWVLRVLLFACLMFILRRVCLVAAVEVHPAVHSRSAPTLGSKRVLALLCILRC
jgi:hypothetical protein